MKRLTCLVASICFGASFLQVSSQETNTTDVIDVSALSCGELLSAPQSDASLAIVLIYGYMSGDNDYTKQSALKIETVIQSALKSCASEPDQSVMSALESAGIGGAS